MERERETLEVNTVNTVDGRNLAPVKRLFIPLFIGFQPSFWWCRISFIHGMSMDQFPAPAARTVSNSGESAVHIAAKHGWVWSLGHWTTDQVCGSQKPVLRQSATIWACLWELERYWELLRPKWPNFAEPVITSPNFSRNFAQPSTVTALVKHPRMRELARSHG